MTTELVISFEVDGLHAWPNAPVEYEEFRNFHRHLFKIICFKQTSNSVEPNRREIELWELRQETLQVIINEFGSEPCSFGAMSCEGIAGWIKKTGKFGKVFVGEEYWLGAIIS
jgi:hypothetical protein